MKTLTGKNSLPLPFKHWKANEYHGFLGTSTDDTFFGVEIEYEFGTKFRNKYHIGEESSVENDFNYKSTQGEDTVRRHINNINKLVGQFAIIKDDGSLKYGIEIVSAPASFVRHKTIWREFFDSLGDFNLESKDTCGMHIHVSKDNFNNDDIRHLRIFLNVNKDNVEKIAGRKSNKYCNYTQTDALPNQLKYAALNTKPPETIEFRIFKAPENYEDFIIRLQFVRALTLWVRGRKVITFAAFEKFLAGDEKYLELYKFIVNNCK